MPKKILFSSCFVAKKNHFTAVVCYLRDKANSWDAINPWW